MAQTHPHSSSFKNKMINLIIKHNKAEFITLGTGYGSEEQLECIYKVISSKEDLMSKRTEYFIPSVCSNFFAAVSVTVTTVGVIELIMGLIKEGTTPHPDDIASTNGPTLIREGIIVALTGFIIGIINTVAVNFYNSYKDEDANKETFDKIFDDANLYCSNELDQITCNGLDNTCSE